MKQIAYAVPEVATDIATTVQLDTVESPTLRRLIEEVRNEKSTDIHAYDRIHNRHNRS